MEIMNPLDLNWLSIFNKATSFFFKRNIFTIASAVRRSDGHLRWVDKQRDNLLSSVISKRTNQFNDLLTRNGGRGLINYFLRIVSLIYPRLSSLLVIQVVMFTRFCFKMRRHRGSKGLTLYLKACQVLLQQSIGGYKVKDLTELKVRPKRNRYGSPLLIHRSVRPFIHKMNDEKVIRFWMTLLGLYRVVNFKGSLKLSTITQPFKVSDSLWTTG